MFGTEMEVEFKIENPLLEELGGLPCRETEGAGAMDLRACVAQPVTLRPGDGHRFDLGFSMHIANRNVAAIIIPRSGYGTRGLHLRNAFGFIDSDYTGELTAHAINVGDETFVIKPGERIFQMAFLPVVLVRPLLVKEFSSRTRRGSGGYGSTGS